MAHYKWQNTMYPPPHGPIKCGVYAGDTDMHSTDVMHGTSMTIFAYLDSDVVTSQVSSWNADNTSRVEIQLLTEWSVTFDNRNNMTVTINVTLVSLARTAINGSPGHAYGRNIRFYPSQAAFNPTETEVNQIAHYYEKYIDQYRTYATNVPLGTQTFTIPPAQEANRSSIFVYNKTAGYDSAGDWMNMGVHFINDMPPDYRPGAILVNGVWQSHNRSAGESHIRCNNRWSEMRTNNGHSQNDDPPSIYIGDHWTDQLLLGKEN